MSEPTSGFAEVAPYLKDPLVLSGFFVFLAFLFARLVVVRLLPPLNQSNAVKILRLILLYGFIIGLALILLGFGLKYRELSEDEQRRAIRIINEELRSNIGLAQELEKNADNLVKNSTIIAGLLRDERFPITSGLFPVQNFREPETFAPADALFDDVMKSPAATAPPAPEKHAKLCGALSRTLDKTRATFESLSDTNGERYRLERKMLDGNAEILRRIDLASLDGLESAYRKLANARATYDRVTTNGRQYLDSLREFCRTGSPDQTAWSLTLAQERLFFSVGAGYQARIGEFLIEAEAVSSRLSAVRI